MPMWTEITNRETEAEVAHTRAKLEAIRIQKQEAAKQLKEHERLGNELRQLKLALHEQQQSVPSLVRNLAQGVAHPPSELPSAPASALISTPVFEGQGLEMRNLNGAHAVGLNSALHSSVGTSVTQFLGGTQMPTVAGQQAMQQPMPMPVNPWAMMPWPWMPPPMPWGMSPWPQMQPQIQTQGSTPPLASYTSPPAPEVMAVPNGSAAESQGGSSHIVIQPHTANSSPQVPTSAALPSTPASALVVPKTTPSAACSGSSPVHKPTLPAAHQAPTLQELNSPFKSEPPIVHTSPSRRDGAHAVEVLEASLGGSSVPQVSPTSQESMQKTFASTASLSIHVDPLVGIGKSGATGEKGHRQHDRRTASDGDLRIADVSGSAIGHDSPTKKRHDFGQEEPYRKSEESMEDHRSRHRSIDIDSKHASSSVAQHTPEISEAVSKVGAQPRDHPRAKSKSAPGSSTNKSQTGARGRASTFNEASSFEATETSFADPPSQEGTRQGLSKHKQRQVAGVSAYKAMQQAAGRSASSEFGGSSLDAVSSKKQGMSLSAKIKLLGRTAIGGESEPEIDEDLW